MRRAVVAALAALRIHREVINDANVYPVRDSDTGTNLVATMEAVASADGAGAFRVSRADGVAVEEALPVVRI